jgi:hypothetical protein
VATFLSLLALRTRRAFFGRRLDRVSPFVRGQLLAESRRLNRAGYTVAAVVTARVAIERLLRELAFAHPEWNPGKSGLGGYLMFLHRVGAVPSHTLDKANAFAKKANSITHGAPVGRAQAWRIIRRAASVAALLEGGAA